jgi:hypothetical protein
MTSIPKTSRLILASLLLMTTPLRADSIPEIVAKAKPAIVEIVIRDATGTPKKLGTGFFISPDGLVLTNQHVIEGADSITAVSNNGAIFLFEHVAAQPAGVDLVVLKFHATDVPFLKLGESTTAVEGQKVIVIGNPTGLMGTVSDGIISAFRENHSLIQITAPISHGSSGSPVMDETGQVIGIATLVIAEGQNLNFAIPVERVPADVVQLPSPKPLITSGLPAATPTPAPVIPAPTPPLVTIRPPWPIVGPSAPTQTPTPESGLQLPSDICPPPGYATLSDISHLKRWEPPAGYTWDSWRAQVSAWKEEASRSETLGAQVAAPAQHETHTPRQTNHPHSRSSKTARLQRSPESTQDFINRFGS